MVITTTNHGALFFTIPLYGSSTAYIHRHRDTNRATITYHNIPHVESCNVNSHHVISQIGQVIPSDQKNSIATYHVQTRQESKLQCLLLKFPLGRILQRS